MNHISGLSATVNPLDEWAFAIGNLILNFGTLDLSVFAFLQTNLSPVEFAKAKEEPFKYRLKRAGKILSLSDAKRTADLLKTIEPLREFRNHLAHGLLYVQIDAGTLTPSLTIARAKDQDDCTVFGTRKLIVKDILDASVRVADANEAFCQLAGIYGNERTVISMPPPNSSLEQDNTHQS